MRNEECDKCKLSEVEKCKLCHENATEGFKRKVKHIVENLQNKGDIITYIDKEEISGFNKNTEIKVKVKLY